MLVAGSGAGAAPWAGGVRRSGAARSPAVPPRSSAAAPNPSRAAAAVAITTAARGCPGLWAGVHERTGRASGTGGSSCVSASAPPAAGPDTGTDS